MVYNETISTLHNQGIQSDTLDTPQSRYTNTLNTPQSTNTDIPLTLHNQGMQSDTLDTPQSRYTIKHSQHSTIKVYSQTLHNQVYKHS